MKSVPTLLDVANHTGFSKATVSRALRGDPLIPETTRMIIRKAARTLEYHPNPMLASLSAHRWSRHPTNPGATLAVVANAGVEGEEGMRARATKLGYQLEIFQIGDYPDPRRLAEVLYSRGILGVIVAQISTPGFCKAFDWSHFVAVACGEGSERPPLNLVMPNHFLAMQDACDHALALGYRRIGLAMFDDPMALDVHDRQAAFLERQKKTPKADRIPILAINTIFPKAISSEMWWTGLAKQTDEWLRRHRPDVVLGFNDTFFWALKDASWRIPKQIAFISLWSISSIPRMTGLVLPPDEVGARAIDWLDSLMRAGERGIPKFPAMMMINMQWQAGKTAPGMRTRNNTA